MMQRPRFNSLEVPGGLAGGVTPVPIPNTEVKPSKADDTAAVRQWDSRTLPGYKKSLLEKSGRLFYFCKQSLPCRVAQCAPPIPCLVASIPSARSGADRLLRHTQESDISPLIPYRMLGSCCSCPGISKRPVVGCVEARLCCYPGSRSKPSCPFLTGDDYGKKLPVINNLIEILDSWIANHPRGTCEGDCTGRCK